MYLQVTTKCNMTCQHCCYSCGPRGRHAPMDVIRQALLQFSDEYITIGGGEPTLHPNFWEILGLCLGYSANDEGSIHIITNGTNKNISLTLLRMSKRGIIGAELSLDQWHDRSMVDPEVIEEYSRPINPNTTYPWSRIRQVIEPSRTGRGKRVGYVNRCVCDDMLIDPQGLIYACGCRKEKFGTVFKPKIPDDYYNRDEKCSERR